jgi:hypothetical protein
VTRFLKKLALLMLIAGLPLQNLHAVAMPLCNQDKETTAAHPQSALDGAQVGEMDEHDHADHQHTSVDTNKACDGCSQCQVCSAPAIASVAIDVLLDPVQTPPLTLAIHPSLFVPEQLQRPPSQFLA